MADSTGICYSEPNTIANHRYHNQLIGVNQQGLPHGLLHGCLLCVARLILISRLINRMADKQARKVLVTAGGMMTRELPDPSHRINRTLHKMWVVHLRCLRTCFLETPSAAE
jgi:hypothetical protein